MLQTQNTLDPRPTQKTLDSWPSPRASHGVNQPDSPLPCFSRR
jgi:hypothetical protein